jgi:flagellar assembly factor FliW
MTVPALVMPRSITVTSDVLGVLTVDPDAVLTFPHGLLGFPECRSFVLLPTEREHVYWVQSVDYTPLVFLAVDPFVFFPGYTVDLAATDLGAVATSPNDVLVLALVTLPSSKSSQPTANLQGPVVINTVTRTAHQAVLSDTPYTIRESFDL